MAHHSHVQYAQIAQLVEQGTENPCVLGSIPSLGTTLGLELCTAELFFYHILLIPQGIAPHVVFLSVKKHICLPKGRLLLVYG